MPKQNKLHRNLGGRANKYSGFSKQWLEEEIESFWDEREEEQCVQESYSQSFRNAPLFVIDRKTQQVIDCKPQQVIDGKPRKTRKARKKIAKAKKLQSEKDYLE